MMLRRATEKICRIYNGYYEIHFPESATLEDYLCYTGDDDHNAMVSRFLSVVRKEQRDRLEWLRVWGDECVFMEENPDQIRHNADKLYLNVKKMMVYMMEATKEMCLRIDHMENLQGRSFADDILPGYQSEEELEALEEQRQKEQRKSSMSKIKLIASDLDGTLLLNFAKNCNPELFPIVEELTRKGIYFVPASGRQYVNLQKLFAPVKDDIMYLCENGALVMHSDQVLVKKQFEDSLALDICHTVMDHPDCEIVISGERTSYLIPKSKDFVTHVRDVGGNHVTVIDAPERIEEPIIKVSYFTQPEKQEKATAEFREKYPDDRCIIVTKEIGERLGIAPDEMAAFGDNENDRAMLEFVGHPYLMEVCNPTMENIVAERCKKVEDTLKQFL